MQCQFQGGLFTTIFVPDDERNGRSLELHHILNGDDRIVAEIFIPNLGIAPTFALFATELPFHVVDELIKEMKIRHP